MWRLRSFFIHHTFHRFSSSTRFFPSSFRFTSKPITTLTLAGSLTLWAYYQLYPSTPQDHLLSDILYTDASPPHLPLPFTCPSRQDLLKTLKSTDPPPSFPTSSTLTSTPPNISSSSTSTTLSSEPNQFDLLIIGGGATGCGVALDAVTRGLKVALVERDDFSAGTSSRSTKLVHGGVRYLEKAFLEFDYEQFKMVKEALHERANFLKIAPYLSYQLPIMLPLYKFWQVPYYWLGCKVYDVLAGKESLESSYFLSKTKALEAFPMLRKENLIGALVYYDGQHNDSRMNVALALTAIAHGAILLNHIEVMDLLKNEKGQLIGAQCKDILTQTTFPVYAKGIINATGPFTDHIRLLDDPTTEPIVAPSSGVHIVLPNYYSPSDMGLLDPHTSDGRVIFFLPWQNQTIAGTTDAPCPVEPQPKPTETEIGWLLDEIKRYLNKDIQVRRGDVLAAWSGIRPLVKHPNKTTAGLVRHHMLHVTPSGLLTIAGGKWTTYRAMAEDTVNLAIASFQLTPELPHSVTDQIALVGTHGYTSTLFIRLIQHFGLDTEVAKHLAQSYGDKAWIVASYAAETGHAWPIFGRKLVPGFPYLEAEVYHAIRNEYACTLIDVIARRLRLAFLNAQLAYYALPKILDIMAKEGCWDDERRKQEYISAVQFLESMGLTPIQRTHLTKSELTRVKDQFYMKAAQKGGVLTKLESALLLQDIMVGQGITKSMMDSCLSCVQEEKLEFQDFLQLLVCAKEAKDEVWKSNRTGEKEKEKQKEKEQVRIFPPLNIDRSGGGV